MRTFLSFVRMAESMTRTIVGRMSKGEHQGCGGEPAEAEPFPAASRTTGTSRKTAAKPKATVGIVVMNRTMPATVATEEAFFPPSCMAQATPTARGQLRSRAETDSRERAHDHGQDAEFVGIRTLDPAEYLAPCALNTTGSAKQAMRRRQRTEAPASHAASRGVRRVP